MDKLFQYLMAFVLLSIGGCNLSHPKPDTKRNVSEKNLCIPIDCGNQSTLNQLDFSDTTIKITPLKQISGYYDREPFHFFTHYHADFRTFLCLMKQLDSSISSFVYDSSKKFLKIIAEDDYTSFSNKNFFYRTHDHETSFYYYRYYDIYKSLFRFAEVDNIEIWVAGKNKTYLPLEGDAGFLLPHGMMKRKWLVPEEKYDELFSGKDAFGFTHSTAKLLTMELRETFMDSVAEYVQGKIPWK